MYFLESKLFKVGVYSYIYSNGVDIRVEYLPPPDNKNNNGDSSKHQHNYRHSKACRHDSVTSRLRVVRVS